MSRYTDAPKSRPSATESAAPCPSMGRTPGTGKSVEEIASLSIDPTQPMPTPSSSSSATRKPASGPSRSTRESRKARCATAFPYPLGGATSKDIPREEDDDDAGTERWTELEDRWKAALEKERVERRQEEAWLMKELGLEARRREGQAAAAAEEVMKDRLQAFERLARAEEAMEGARRWAWAQRFEQVRKAADARAKEKAERLRKAKELAKRANLMFSMADAKWDALKAGTLTDVPFEEFPWPVLNGVRSPADITLESVRNYVFHPLRRDAQAKSPKEKVMAELLIFHPDKFNGLFLSKVRENEREMAQETAGLVAGFLNQLKGD